MCNINVINKEECFGYNNNYIYIYIFLRRYCKFTCFYHIPQIEHFIKL